AGAPLHTPAAAEQVGYGAPQLAGQVSRRDAAALGVQPGFRELLVCGGLAGQGSFRHAQSPVLQFGGSVMRGGSASPAVSSSCASIRAASASAGVMGSAAGR